MKAVKWLDKHLEEVILVLLLSLIVLVMLYQIVMRYVFNDSLTWSEEFCRYCFIWFMFVGFSYSIRFDLDLRVDAIVNLLPVAVKKGISAVGLLMCLALTSYPVSYTHLDVYKRQRDDTGGEPGGLADLPAGGDSYHLWGRRAAFGSAERGVRMGWGYCDRPRARPKRPHDQHPALCAAIPLSLIHI